MTIRLRLEGLWDYGVTKKKNMSLRDVQNELYGKHPNKEMFQHGKSEFSVDPARLSSLEKKELFKDDWLKKETGLGEKNKAMIRKGMFFLGGLLLLILLLVGFYRIRQSFFAFERLVLTVSGPLEIKSGNLSSYAVKWKNDNRADLENVTLRLSYPEDFKPEESAEFKLEGETSGIFSLGEVKGKSEGQVVFNGRAYSPKGNLIKIKAEMSYTPSTVSSLFASSDQLIVNVISAPITLEVMAPQNISSSDEINYLITYKNEGQEEFENIRIRIDYSEQFTFSSSEPRVSEGNNIWYLGTLSPGQSGKIVVVGKLEGNRDEVKTAKIAIGAKNNGGFVSYNETEAQTKIATSPLAITQTVNELHDLSVKAGDPLQFRIDYKNEGMIGLRDVIVTEHLDSPVLDYSTLTMNGGTYDAESKTITWKAADYRELKNLAPGQGGTIRFSIRVKDVIPVKSANDRNFVISSLAKIDSPDIPTPISMNKIISGNKMDLKLDSKLVLDVKGYYNDTKLPNSGPIPPKVGEETTYTIHYIVSSVSNDVEDAKVEASLPTAVFLTGKIFPEGEPLTYNERTNSLVWEIGKLEAGTGVLFPGKEVSFQVRIKPSSNQTGSEAPLLGVSVFSAKDLFTGEDISAKVDGKSTHLLEDEALGTDYKVVSN